MIIGVMSDSHGQHARVGAAVRLLESRGAQYLVHCGDLGGERVLDELAGRSVSFVWGNGDYPDARLLAYARRLGLKPPEEVPLCIELGQRRLCVFHGHETLFMRLTRWLDKGETARIEEAIGRVDYVLYGHTHVANDLRLGGLRLINPGALHRAAEHTVATLDLARDAVEFLTVD